MSTPPLTPVFDGIPPRLTTPNRWMLWRVEDRGGNPTKVPYQANGRKADATDSATWATLGRVSIAYQKGRFAGVGFVLGDGFAGVDLDDCRDPDTSVIAPWATDIISRLDSYAEVSPSGTGVKIIVRGAKPSNDRCRVGNIEVYDRDRYFALTGRPVPGTPADVNERSEQLAALYHELFPDKGKPASPGTTPPPPLDASDEEILTVAFRAKNGADVKRLYDGGTEGYDSKSEADLALNNHLAFYFHTADRIDRIFRTSALYRSKWERATYRDPTIAKALDGRTEFYTPRRRKGPKVKFNGKPIDPGTNGVHHDTDEPEKPNAEAAVPPEEPPPVVIELRQYIRDKINPTFRRGKVFYSSTWGREVSQAELSAAPTWDILRALAGLDDAPRDRKGNPDPSYLPAHFRNWLPVAWGDIAAKLPEEADSPEVSDLAREEFVGRLKAAVLTIVAIAYNRGNNPDDVQRRPIIGWAESFAKPGQWGDVRGYRIWGRKDNNVLRIALRSDLFSQLHARDLAGLAQRRFTDLCLLYGVGTPTAVKGGTARATELTQDFIADVLWNPNDPHTQEDQTHAPACDPASVRMGEEVNIDAIKH